MSIHEQQPQQSDTQTCHNLHLVGACILYKSVPLLLRNYSKSQPSFFLMLQFQKQITLFFFCFFYFGPESKTAAAGSSGAPKRPPWVTDPNFADRFHPDKTSTVVTQHQQPVQPTPMQNRSSILQAAQQAPEDSGRTPVCGACNKIIRLDGTATAVVTV